MIQMSGAEYAYLLRAFGALPAFMFSWVSMLLLKPSSVAIIALTCAEYVMVPLFDDDCGSPPNLNTKLTAAVVICEYPARKGLGSDLEGLLQITGGKQERGRKSKW